MRTHTGRFIDPLNLTMADICIEDIAHHLSNICRFNGAVAFHYSVAQHSVYVAQCTQSERHKLHALLHDASEAYLTDVPRPIKYTPEFAFYRELEKRVQGTIMARFGITEEMPPEIKEWDDALLVSEGIALLNYRYDCAPRPADIVINEWTPFIAKRAFLQAFHKLISYPVI